MPFFICTACGTQYAQTPAPPAVCDICEDERQYVPPGGQTWTQLDALRLTHMNAFHKYENGVLGIGTQPTFGIGQRALLLRTANGNVLWDCISLIDDATITLIRALGGIAAIAISHPHFYTSMIEWSEAFGGAPIYLHAADRDWVKRLDPAIHFWDGETRKLWDGVTLIRCGGHFPGSAVLHWADGAGGVLCTGDTLSVTQDRKFVSFMRSYPNFLPVSGRDVERIADALAPYSFDTIYGHYFDRVINAGAKQAVRISVERYLAAIEPKGKFGFP